LICETRDFGILKKTPADLQLYSNYMLTQCIGLSLFPTTLRNEIFYSRMIINLGAIPLSNQARSFLGIRLSSF